MSEQKPDGVVKYWLKEIDAASNGPEKDWREQRATNVTKRYRDEREGSEAQDVRFNILFANVEVLKGVMYQRPPVPDVRRRFKDPDAVGRVVAEVLTRALTYCIDAYDFDFVMRQCVSDVLIPGRGVARVKYIPTFAQMEREVEPTGYEGDKPIYAEGVTQRDGKGYQSYEQVSYEEVRCDQVGYEYFRMSPAKHWSKVRWISFGELLSRQDCVKQFGKEIGSAIKLDWSDRKDDDPDKDDERYRRALVWTIWNKSDKQVYVISAGYPAGPLKQEADPLRLEQFFPIPRPMYAIWTTDSLVPVPEYTQYQDQAEELDLLTERINVLVDALRRRGVYDASMPALEELAKAGDNTFIPVTNYAALVEKGGLQNAFSELPIEGIAKVLVELYQQREQVKQTIYEVMGIGDIIRGSSDPNETASAQNIKAQYAQTRIAPRQTEVQRFARDLLRLKAEIIAEHFSQQTLQQMTGIQLPTPEQKQMAQQQVSQMQAQAQQQPQQPGQPPAQPPQIPKEIQTVLNTPTWDDVMGLLKNEKLRGFRIDVETDSTIAANDQAEKENVVEMIQAMSGLAAQVGPLIQEGVVPAEFLKSLLLFTMRRFRASKDIEEQIEQLEPPPPKQDPEMQKMQMEMQMQQQKAQQDGQLAQAKMQQDAQLQTHKLQQDGQLQTQKLAQEHDLGMKKIMAESQLEAVRIQHDAHNNLMQTGAKIAESGAKAAHKEGPDVGKALATALQNIANALQAPKELVRDKTGRPSGVRTVQ